MPPKERTSLLCPNCRKLISADEPVCPYCGLSKPGSRNIFYGGLNNLSLDITQIIIYLNGGFYILSLLLSATSITLSVNPFTMLSPSERALLILGATGTIPIVALGRWWTLISASFLHGGLMHIFFNMMALRQLGPFVVQEYGLNRFVIIYTLTGIIGFFLSYLAGIPLTIGASASICGLIGAILYYGKSRGGFYGENIYRQALGWVVGLVIYGFLIPGINNWAHGGGVASGVLFAWWLGYLEMRRQTIVHKALAQACLVLTGLVLLYVIFQTAYVYLFLNR